MVHGSKVWGEGRDDAQRPQRRNNSSLGDIEIWETSQADAAKRDSELRVVSCLIVDGCHGIAK
jgi:hypothetical protein